MPKVISSSAQVALPPAFARLEQRGVQVTLTKVQKVIGLSYGRKSGLGPIN